MTDSERKEHVKKDAVALKYAGLMGHQSVVIRTYPNGDTRVCSEIDEPAHKIVASKSLERGDRIYGRNQLRKSPKWILDHIC